MTEPTKRTSPWFGVMMIIVVFVALSALAVGAAIFTVFGEKNAKVSKESVLVVELKGVIWTSKRLVKQLREYGEDPQVKAIVIRLESPGGAVGATQEIYDQVQRLKKMGKPVVASLGNIAASGAYYVAVACDKIVTNPGTITGSIGVIMGFMDMSKLYDFAKVSRFSIKSGKFKDTGSEYRPMNPEERDLMQGMVDNVYGQFKRAVAEGRKLKIEQLKDLADGRVFSGEQAVKAMMADSLGGPREAVALAAEMAGISGEPEIFTPPPRSPRLKDLLMGNPDEEEEMGESSILGLNTVGKPMFLMPGVLH